MQNKNQCVLSKEMVEKLVKLAKSEAWDDGEEFCVDDYSAGNADDAFYGGQQSGEINMARKILKDIGLDY